MKFWNKMRGIQQFSKTTDVSLRFKLSKNQNEKNRKIRSLLEPTNSEASCSSWVVMSKLVIVLLLMTRTNINGLLMETSTSSFFYQIPENYNWEFSTTENYRHSSSYNERGPLFAVGEFGDLREKLDYNYHSIYQPDREIFQDSIIRYYLSKPIIVDENGDHCHVPTQPWIVFTAGAMGSGKTYTMNQLAHNDLFPLESFVVVDPDEIRRHLPEFEVYVKNNPEHAGELTRMESGMIAELLTLAALSSGRNVLVDGSLKDHEWYQQYFRQLREDYPRLQIAILHITAPKQTVLERAENRSKTTGRVVPQNTLLDALERVPKSVKKLSPMVDFVCELNNTHEVTLESDGMTWDKFRNTWVQSCDKNLDGNSICNNKFDDCKTFVNDSRNFPKSKL